MSLRINELDGIFFDLDGTLLGLSDKDFEEIYSRLITKRFDDLIDPEEFIKALWIGTEAMYEHDDPERHVLETFFNSFTQITGIPRDEAYERFNKFYQNEFGELEKVVKPVPEARHLMDVMHERELKVVLATNPVFPEIATRRRCNWTNLDYDEFDFVSHAENSFACKPNPRYYTRLCEIVNVNPSKVLMVGNDYLFDMAAASVGLKTWMVDRFQGNLEYKDKVHVDYSDSLTNLLKILSK